MAMSGCTLGEKMTGGKITVNGNTMGWTGSQMKGGLIEIRGMPVTIWLLLTEEANLE